MSRKTRQEGRTQGMSTAMGKEGKEEGVPGCKIQSTGESEGRGGTEQPFKGGRASFTSSYSPVRVLVSEIRQSWAVACE